MKQKYEEFRKKCYEKYQLNWMLSHGYSLQDLIDAMNEKYMEDDSRECHRSSRGSSPRGMHQVLHYSE